jgi:hypothetical protein
MKNRFELWQVALEELSVRCAVENTGDINTVLSRMKHEGDAFFDITLPKFGKDFERALAHLGVVEGLFVGWKRKWIKDDGFFTSVTLSMKRRHIIESLALEGISNEDPEFMDRVETLVLHDMWRDAAGELQPDGLETRPLPEFLGGFLRVVFDQQSGLLLHHAKPETGSANEPAQREVFDRQVDAIHAVRQLTLMFGKVEQKCSPARVSAAVAQYVETDRQIGETLDRLTSRPDFFNRDILPLKKVFLAVFGDAMTRLDKIIFDGNLVPAHGPGKTADRLDGNQKFCQFEWTDRMEELFPYGDYAIPNWRHAYALDRVVWRSPEDERPVKLVDVPKTASTPRLIALEPTCMQYMQQAVMRPLVDLLESCEKSRPFVGFRAQWPNQVLAQMGSEDGSLATLDLSEASDRVPNWLVEELLENWPHVNEAFQVTRSLRADVPEVGVIPLQKYASMGSALTFPIEAMVFATVVLKAMCERDNKAYSWTSIKRYRDKVRVYGDDIIVPNGHAVTVARSLESYGFKVNSAKSFWTGGFRESCGKEYYRGEDVSIVRFRQVLPRSLHDVTEIMSTVETRNQLFQAGMMGLVRMLDDVLVEVLNGHYPYVTETSPVLGRLSPSGLYEIHGLDDDLHAPFVRGYVSASKSPVNWLDSWHALLKGLLLDYDNDVVRTDHLDRSGRPSAARIKLTNAQPF